MVLRVVGSGFGRTGTRSMQEALEILGFGPCHHMEEIFGHPEQVANWQAIAAGKTVDWTQVFAGYNSQVDWPGAHVWRETTAAFPDAKVIHTIRPDDGWWGSFSGTIGKFLRVYKDIPLPPHIAAMSDVIRDLVADGTFHGKAADKDAALAAYHQRLAEVRAAIPASRLLVFDVADGWTPLCKFLEVPVPDAAFPNRNQKGDFWANLGGEPA
ncbi:MAG: sulfotransferase family protein [bacterium]